MWNFERGDHPWAVAADITVVECSAQHCDEQREKALADLAQSYRRQPERESGATRGARDHAIARLAEWST